MVLWFWLRIIELSERDLWRSSSPILVQGKSNKNKLLRALSKWAFDTFRDRKPSTTLSSMFQCLMTLILYFSCYLWIEFYLLQPRTLVPLSFCSTPLETSTKSFHFFLILTLNAPGPTAHLHRTCAPAPSHHRGLPCTHLTTSLKLGSPELDQMLQSHQCWRGEQILFLTYWLHLITKYKVAIFTARACWTLTDFS